MARGFIRSNIKIENMSSTIVQKIWNFCNTLRDDGVSYGDYLEQLTYLLFLKMADEYSKPPHKRKDINIPAEMNWESLTEKSGDELERHYNKILRSLGKGKRNSRPDIHQEPKQNSRPG